MYGLTTMPAEFQRVVFAILSEFPPQADAFLDDVLIVKKGSKIEHTSAIGKILRNFD